MQLVAVVVGSRLLLVPCCLWAVVAVASAVVVLLLADLVDGVLVGVVVLAFLAVMFNL